MAPPGMPQDFLHKRLSTQFHSPDPVAPQEIQKVFVNLIGLVEIRRLSTRPSLMYGSANCRSLVCSFLSMPVKVPP
jgi:hypothetical protein